MNIFGKNIYQEGNIWDKPKILKKIESLKPWWHKIDLGNGIVTPGGNYEWVWEPIQRLMDKVDYRGKKVVDLGSWDGKWAFEAEKRGASLVVATDVRLLGLERIIFVKSVLNSKIVPLYGVPVQDIEKRLAVFGLSEKFDIVQHFGLFYHLRDPLLSLAQCRRILSDHGQLLIETAYIDDDEKSYMAFNGLPNQFHFYGIGSTWAPTKRCLREILIRSFFNPVNEENWQYAIHPDNNQPVKVGRICMTSDILPEEKGHEADRLKVFGTE